MSASVPESPQGLFLMAFIASLGPRLPDYTILPSYEIPSQESDCPRLCADYMGDVDNASSANRSRRRILTGTMRITGWRWVDGRPRDVAYGLLDEYHRIQRAIQTVLWGMQVHGQDLPAGLMLLSPGQLAGSTADVSVNSRNTSATHPFTIRDITLETIIGDP